MYLCTLGFSNVTILLQSKNYNTAILNVFLFLLLVHVAHEPGKEILNRNLLLSQWHKTHKTTTFGGTLSYQQSFTGSFCLGKGAAGFRRGVVYVLFKLHGQNHPKIRQGTLSNTTEWEQTLSQDLAAMSRPWSSPRLSNVMELGNC